MRLGRNLFRLITRIRCREMPANPRTLIKEFFHELAMATMAGKKAKPKDVDVDEAGKEFVQAHHEDKMSRDAGKSKDAYRNRM